MKTGRHPLIVDVETLPPEGETFALTIDEAGLRRQWRADDDLADWAFQPVDSEIRLTPAPGGITLEATVTIRCIAPCIRCLDPIELALDDRITLRFERPDATRELRLSDASLDILEFDGVSIDLTAWLAAQVLLSIPDLPRCESHAGRPCAGPALSALTKARPDPRWAALAALRNEHDA